MVIYAPLSLVLSTLHKRSQELKQSSTAKQSVFFFSKSVNKTVKCGVRVLRAKQASLTSVGRVRREKK